MKGKIFKGSTIFLVVFGCFVFGFFAEAQTSPPALDYAPNLWFDSQEKYYPANPLDFYFENSQEIEGEKAVNKYNQLSLEEKLDKMTVFYHIEDEGVEWVYEYWFFYVFNDSLGKIKNEHYGDWESVYVFVDKNSEQIIKVIGTAHQRRIFDTEINNPEIDHIWSYIGGGSHANCVDDESDGYCDFAKWRTFEKWDKNGSKILYNNYKLTEISPDFIDNFNGAISLEKSSELGINLLEHLWIENKELYISLGGDSPYYAWEQSSYENPEEIRPISRKLVVEYISNKVNQVKDKVVGFFNDVFGNVEPEEQQASILDFIEVNAPEEVRPLPVAEPAPAEVGPLMRSDLISEPESIPESMVIDAPEEVRPQERSDLEIETETESDFVSGSELIAPPSFISGGGAYIPPEPELQPTPEAPADEAEAEIIDTIPPSDITDLLAQIGSSRGEINLSWTAPGADQYIVRYSTSSVSWASSTDIIGEPTPGLASSTESLIVSDLDTSQVYYWAIKSQDAAGNLSGISNSASSSPYAPANSLVISEIQVKGSSYLGNLPNDEFIELYNPTDSAVNISGWSIQYRGSELESFIKNDFAGGNSVPAHGYFLIANSGYDGHMVADMSHNSFQMSATGGTVFLVNNDIELTDADDNSIIDKMAYGSGTYLFPETAEFTLAPDYNQSLERKNNSISTAVSLAVGGDQHWQGNNWDGNNNSTDFVLQATTSPQNSLSLTEPRNSFASLADTDWPMIQGNLQHTGLSSYSGNVTGSPTSTPKWRYPLSTTGPNIPVIGPDGSIYVGAGNGNLYKVTAAGATSTFYSVGVNGPVKASAFASDGTVYMNDGKNLYALTSDGQVIWKYPVYYAYSSAPVIGPDGTIYVASNYYLYALTPNGEQIWRNSTLSYGNWIMSPVLDSNGNIYTVGQIGSNGIVYALNSLDGSIIWQTDPGSYYTALSLDDQGTLYVGSFSGLASAGLYALNSTNGSQKWYISIGGILGSVPAIHQDTIYVGTYHNNTFYSVNKLNEIVNWTYYFGGDGDKISASPIIDSQGVI
ncbi:PQQ-binding-like beta-propeller repeat protein, partial [Patescibacteria group bacterium]|nr:PQQ-binding-like beta-propeller repeat protein [Patescibacteria group bacterium]